MSEILYRKWRPTRFGDVAGQEHVATTLKNALATGRVAHAYLLSGPRGTGKTSTGRLLAKALNCTDRQDGEPCNRCESCQAFLAGRAMDLIELDAASNRGIDEIRSLRDKVAFAPGAGAYKIYLIDEVHMLTEAAFNALLKTLEEPPPHVVFILATTEAHKLPATIASRCQRFDLRRIPLAAAVARLQTICEGEGIRCEPAALELIARSATGSLRDGVNLLDQLATSYGNDLTVEHVRAGLGLIGDARASQMARRALAGDLAGGLSLIAAVRDDGLDLRQFQRELIDELRDLLMVKSGLQPAEGATEERLQELRTTAEPVPTATLLRALKAFGEADLKSDPNSTLPLDIALAECVLGVTAAPAFTEASPAAAPPRQASTTAPPTQRAQPPAASQPSRPPATPVPPQAPPAPPPAPSTPVRAVPVDDAPFITDDEPPPYGEYDAPPAARPQAPAPPPAPVAPAASGASGADNATLEAARGHMRAIYEKARAKGFQLGALLNGGCDIIEADGAGLVFGFQHEFHASKASERDNLATLTAVASEVLGRPINVRCTQAPGVVAWTKREAAARGREHPLVKAAQQMGATILATYPSEAEEPEDYR